MIERHVLKVPEKNNEEPSDDMMMGLEPQSQDQMNEPNMEGDPMAGENLQGDDDGFDAGIESNPEEDPKKYIQQLSGKLSQELRGYNQDQEKPDTELNKYVAGMIIPQATKDMTDKEKDEVIKKIKDGSTNDSDIDDSNEDSNEDLNNELSDDSNMPTESKRKKINSIVNEIINSFNNDKKERKEKKLAYKSKKMNPFVSDF